VKGHEKKTVVTMDNFKMMTVIQTEKFLKNLKAYFPKEEYVDELVTYLAFNPQAGVVVEDSKGYRKIRWPAKAKGAGKRGGYRIFFKYDSSLEQVKILAIIAKNDQEDLSQDEKRLIKKRE